MEDFLDCNRTSAVKIFFSFLAKEHKEQVTRFRSRLNSGYFFKTGRKGLCSPYDYLVQCFSHLWVQGPLHTST